MWNSKDQPDNDTMYVNDASWNTRVKSIFSQVSF